MKKRLGGKPKGRGMKIPRLRLPSAFQPKDPCYGRLRTESQELAAEAHANGALDALDGKLLCECGKLVGGKQSPMGSYFEPSPSPHERYKEPRKPARKPGGSKRI